MVVRVTKFPRQVRPQWGLSRADHIYEHYHEAGLTRFVGVFYGQESDRIGPILSARPFDEQLMRMYKGIFAFGNADRRVYDALIETDMLRYLVIKRPGNCPPMCRIGPDYDYNTLYTNTAQLSQYIIEKGFKNIRQNLDGSKFMVDKAHGGGLANYIFTRFSRSSYHMWQYDPTANQYLRSQELDSREEGEEVYDPLFDNLTSERISADNLVILFVPALQYFESNSTDIYNFNLIGSGKAYAMRDGRIFKILWNRPSSESMIRLVLPNGNNYPLKPGNVWFEVLSATLTNKVKNNGLWRFTFDLGL